MSTYRTWYAEQGLPLPPLPAPLEDRLEARAETVWATGDGFESLWDARGLAERAVTDHTQPSALVGAHGRGLASNALYCYVVTDPVALFLEHAFGNVGDDADQLAAEIGTDYAIAGRIIESASRRPAGDRIVVVLSTLRLDAAIHHGGEWHEHRTYDVLHRALDVVSGDEPGDLPPAT